MAASQARSGFGTLFQRGDGGGSEVFTTVAEIKNISGPEEIQETFDVTHMESPNRFRERKVSLLDGGQIKLTMQFIGGDASQNNVRLDMRNGVVRNFRIIVPGAALRWEGAAIVTNISNEFQIDGAMMRDTTLQCTGPWNLVAHP